MELSSPVQDVEKSDRACAEVADTIVDKMRLLICGGAGHLGFGFFVEIVVEEIRGLHRLRCV